MIDFEATARLVRKDRGPRHQCFPDPCAKCMGYAHRYVEAALGNRELFKVQNISTENVFVNSGMMAIGARKGDHKGVLIPVWPLKDSDEGS